MIERGILDIPIYRDSESSEKKKKRNGAGRCRAVDWTLELLESGERDDGWSGLWSLECHECVKVIIGF
jgi:hypothetical protein